MYSSPMLMLVGFVCFILGIAVESELIAMVNAYCMGD